MVGLRYARRTYILGTDSLGKVALLFADRRRLTLTSQTSLFCVATIYLMKDPKAVLARLFTP